MKKFVHLRAYSSYSLSEGAIKIDDLLALARQHNMPAIALADNNNLFGMLEFSTSSLKKSIKPILGLTVKIQHTLVKNSTHLVLYAKNETGFKNLLKLNNAAYEKVILNQDAAITFEELEKFSSGLIILTGGRNGVVNQLLLLKQEKIATGVIDHLHQIFTDNLYIEISRHGYVEEDETEKFLLNIAYQKHIPIVATNEIYYPYHNSYEAHDVLRCIAKGEYHADEERMRLLPHHYFKSPSEMIELFKDLPEAIENTINIAKRCSVYAKEHAPMLPSFTGDNDSENESIIFTKLAKEGLEKRLLENEIDTADHSKYYDRLDYELSVIIKMQFPGYFLIVSDFIKWSKKNNIPVGPGRGSGAGSVVAWSLEITDIDPLKFGLLFERFLNPDRISMPDFDIDFCQERRDEVIKYVQEKYGYYRVAQIITFGKLQARAVLRDVGRVLQLPYTQVDRISKLVPHNPVNPVNLTQALEIEPMLAKAKEDDPMVAKMIEISLQLEGLYRHASTHAAGIIISEHNLDDIVPLYYDAKSTMPIVQYSMKYAEAAGLVKFDFLGLKTLTVIAKSIELLKSQNIEIDINHIPLDDDATFEMLSEGKAIGVFQFESKGMRESIKRLKPDSIDDLIALGALYRPGPMDNIPTYIDCKHGIQEINDIHPKLRELLRETFGVIIYQEQVMEIAKILAGYTLGAADLLRRAMGKKIKSEMDAQRELFVKGSVSNGLTKAQAVEIFELVAKFAGYGFNKSHAAAYGMISYQTAFLKANYSVEFFVASMNYEIHDTDKLNVFVQDLKLMKITLLPVDINFSEEHFKIEQYENNKCIRYSLAALKNVGVQAVANICAIRREKGNFKNIFDFIERISSSMINKRQLENIIKAGAFDSVCDNKNDLLASIDRLMDYASEKAHDSISNQISLFGALEQQTTYPQLRKGNELKPIDRIKNEFDAYGFHAFSHPNDLYSDYIQKYNLKDSRYFSEITALNNNIEMVGSIINMFIRVSAKGRFAFLAISDKYGVYDVGLYDQKILDNRELLSDHNIPFYLLLEVKRINEEFKYTVMRLEPLILYLATRDQKVTFKVKNMEEIQLIKDNIEPGSDVKVEIIVENPDQNNTIIQLPNFYQIKYNNFMKIADLLLY